MAGTAGLRSAAADWSLAGDRQLLELLQNIHQKIMTRCHETNTKLEEMVSALDDASVSLQNVNNRFLSLSDTQFVESRVFDEDTYVAGDTATKKPAAVPLETSDLSSLSLALQTIDKLHEPVTILPDRDSDTDTEDEDMHSTILRPKNMYSDRPLPHITGSYSWKNKWHAGLVTEDSDTDSSTSRVHNKQSDQYSESESELEDAQTDRRAAQGSYVGSVSSSEPSEQELSPQRPSQADVAAELARRLGGAKMAEAAPRVEDDVTTPGTNKIYKPQQPTPGTIFPDEPPPLDTTQNSDFDTYSNEDDDIFAEINKKAPYANDSKAQNQSVDIFADLHPKETRPNACEDRDQNRVERGDVFGDFPKAGAFDKSAPQPVKQKSTLFEDDEDSDLFTQKSQTQPAVKPNGTDNDKSAIKKPAGAISLFGSNKGTESIGAAILNRNRRKSSTSSEESNETNSENHNKNNITPSKAGNDEKIAASFKEKDHIKPPMKVTTNAEKVQPKERDIFDDLFARSEKAQKEAAKSQKSQEPSKKVDLFSDNIFDDIDDIFSSNVVIKKPTKDVRNDKSKAKSLFDDVDDLFSDIGVEKTETKIVRNNTKTEGIFDSDDDLFKNRDVEKKSSIQSNQNIAQLDKPPKSLENLDLLSGKSQSKNDAIQIVANSKSTFLKDDEKFKSIFESDDELFLNKSSSSSRYNKIQENSSINAKSEKTENTDSLFSDNDYDNDNDIFSIIKRPKLTNTEIDKTTVPKTCEAKSQSEDSSTNLISDKNRNKQNNNFKDLNTEPNRKETTVTDDIKDISDPIKLDNGHSSSVNVVPLNTNCNQNDRNEFKEIVSAEKSVESSSIFDDDDETDNLFGKPKEKSKPFENHKSKGGKALNFSSDIKTVNNEYTSSQNFNSSEDNKIATLFENDNGLEGNLFSEVTKNETETQQQNRNQTENILSQDKNDKPSVEKPKLLEKPVTVSKVDLVIQDQTENTKSSEIQNQNVPDTKIVLDNTKINLDNNENLDSSLFAPSESMKSNELKADMFSDLFLDQPPPAFEKPKEPKKSKNVNALFDDDSDDEALFFKKNDNFLDEKPEDFTPIQTEPLFAIFHDEPPAIDTDFIQNNDIIFNKPPINNSKISEYLTEKSIESSEKLPEVTKSTDILDGVRQSKEEEKPKTIGKLKPMNFNINVNTLLPGASPKKQIKINKNNEENAIKSTPESPTEEVKPPLVKSVSFEGDPESPILDNKISKQRAKIQVKRRPSTRRARKEAVRKSIVDLSDETDGSGDRNDDSRDDKVLSQKQKEHICTTNEIKTEAHEKVTKDAKTIPTDTHKDETDYSKEFIDVSDRSEDNQDVCNKDEEKPNIFNDEHYLHPTPQRNAESNANINDIPVMNQEILNEILKENKKVIKDIPQTEVLNINDDDTYIFRDPSISTLKNVQNDDNSKPVRFIKTLGNVYKDNSKTNENEEKITETIKSNKLNIETDDTNDLFKDSATKSHKEPKNNLFGDISTTLPTKTTKKSLFDDLSDDDDLFGGNKKNEPDKSGTKNVFSNNDSEDELFASKKSLSKKDGKAKPVEAKIEKKPEKVKKSLFGDEDDDDDLFGVTKKTSPQIKEKSQQEASSSIVREGNKTTEPVFDDPLTLLGGDDEF